MTYLKSYNTLRIPADTATISMLCCQFFPITGMSAMTRDPGAAMAHDPGVLAALCPSADQTTPPPVSPHSTPLTPHVTPLHPRLDIGFTPFHPIGNQL
jgi:hypothetical protein